MAERSEPISLSFTGSLESLEQFTLELSDHRQLTELTFEDCSVKFSLWPEIRDVLSKASCTVIKLKIIGTDLDREAWNAVKEILKICTIQEFAVEVNEANCQDFLTSCKGIKLESLHFYVRGQMVGVYMANIRDLLNLKSQRKELTVFDVEAAHFNLIEKSGVRMKLPIDVIDVSDNTADDDNWRVVAALLMACDVGELIMQNCVCNVTTTRFHTYPFPSQKLKRVDASYMYLDDLNWHLLRGIVFVCSVDELILKKCRMSAETRQVPEEELGVSRLQLLDMSDNLIDDAAWDRIIKILKDCEVQKVVLQNCDFKSRRPEFRITEEFTAIDISKNDLDCETCELLGKMLKASKVKRLEMHECNLEKDSLKTLAQSEHKLDSIDISQTDLSRNWEGLVDLISVTRGVSYCLTGCNLSNEAWNAVEKALMETNQKLTAVAKRPFFEGVTVDSIKAKILDFLWPSWFHLNKLTLQLRKNEEDSLAMTVAGPSYSVSSYISEPLGIAPMKLPMPKIKVKNIRGGTLKEIAPDSLQHSTILSKCRSQIRDKGIVYLSHISLLISGVYQVAEAVKGSYVKMIVCSGCSLDDGCVVELVNAATQSSGVLEVFDISFNPHLGEKSAKSIAEFVHAKDVKEIFLSGCGLGVHFEKIIKPATLHAKFKAIKIKCADVAETSSSDDRKVEEVPVKSSSMPEARSQEARKNDESQFEKELEVSVTGGKVVLPECHIDFPAGAVDQTTRFYFSLDVGTEFWSDEYLRAGPTLVCRPTAEFEIPVKIRLPVWCSTASENVELIIVREDDESHTLSTVTKRRLKDIPGVIEFECSNFSRFRALYRRIRYGEVIYHVVVAVYSDRRGNFDVAFVVDNSSLERHLDSSYTSRGYDQKPFMFKLKIKTNDRIGIRLGYEEDKHYHQIQEQQHFNMDEKFANELETSISFQEDKFPEKKVLLTIEIQCNDGPVIKKRLFVLDEKAGTQRPVVHVGALVNEAVQVVVDQRDAEQPDQRAVSGIGIQYPGVVIHEPVQVVVDQRDAEQPDQRAVQTND